MIAPDVNVLLYAVDSSSDRHALAKSWLEAQLSGAETIGLSWSVLLAFLRLSTRASIFESPLTVEQAFDPVTSWLDQPPVVVLQPGERHHVSMRELHGAVAASSDRDFARFPGVRWVDPLAADAR